MVLIAAHLNAEVYRYSGGDSVAIGIQSIAILVETV